MILCQVIHGRHDIVAPPQYGERLASYMGCPCVILEGAHFLPREHGTAVNALLKAIILPDVVQVRIVRLRGGLFTQGTESGVLWLPRPCRQCPGYHAECCGDVEVRYVADTST